MATKKSPRTPRASAQAPATKRATRAAGKRSAPAARKPSAKASPSKRSLSRAASSPDSGATSSKQSRLIALLKSDHGATVSQMTELTGWQPHTVRGTISGVLRKKLGLDVSCTGEAGSRVYRIVAA